MSKEELIECTGIVEKCLGDTQFAVRLDGSNHLVTAYASGRIRKHRIRILEGDKVNVEVTAYDLTKGRIKFRQKEQR